MTPETAGAVERSRNSSGSGRSSRVSASQMMLTSAEEETPSRRARCFARDLHGLGTRARLSTEPRCARTKVASGPGWAAHQGLRGRGLRVPRLAPPRASSPTRNIAACDQKASVGLPHIRNSSLIRRRSGARGSNTQVDRVFVGVVVVPDDEVPAQLVCHGSGHGLERKMEQVIALPVDELGHHVERDPSPAMAKGGGGQFASSRPAFASRLSSPR